MSIRWSAYAPCEACQRTTPRRKDGTCVRCAGKLRKAKRKAKAVATGSNFARYGQVLEVAGDLWSVWVRAAADGCAMCQRPLFPNELQWAHGYSRRKYRIRFHLDNSWALCAPCHRRHTPPGPEWYEWMELQLGAQRFRALTLYASVGPRLTRDVLDLTILDARMRIAALPEGERKEWARWREARILEDYVRLGVRVA